MDLPRAALLRSFEILMRSYLTKTEMKQVCIHIAKNWRLQNVESVNGDGTYLMTFPICLQSKVPSNWYVYVSPFQHSVQRNRTSVALVTAGPKSGRFRKFKSAIGEIAEVAGSSRAVSLTGYAKLQLEVIDEICS